MSLPLLFAFLGIAMMVGMAGCGSAIGVSIGGSATLGAVKKREEAFAPGLVLSALPGTQGLYGFGAFFILKEVLTPEITMFQGMVSKSNHMSIKMSLFDSKISISLGVKEILSHISSHCILCP